MHKLFAVICVVANGIMAANVQWDCFDVDYWEQASGNTVAYISYYQIGGTGMTFGTDFESSMSGSQVLVQVAGGVANFSGNIMQSEKGGLIDESTIRHRPESEYLEHCWIDDGMYGGKHVLNVQPNSDFYLMLVVSDGISGPGLNYAYGWMNIGVDAKGNLSLLGSAIDLDGGPMIVGGGSASPEPSGAVLLLLGAGMLGLRRQRPKALSKN